MVITVDFMQQLPYEVTELIISYLSGKDIISCCQVCQDWCDILDRDSTWKLLCRQQTWKKDDGNDIKHNLTWRECYWLNYNWRNGIYKRHQQVVPEGGCLQIGLNQKLVIMSHVLGSQICKFGSLPSIQQDIYCGDLHFQTKSSGNSIVIKLRDSIHIYTQCQTKRKSQYIKIKTISSNLGSPDYDTDLNLDSAIVQTGSDRLVVIQKEARGNKILLWNTFSGFKYTPIYLDDKIRHIFKTIVSNNKLYLVILKDNEYKIKVYNFIKNIWSFEITAFKNVAFGVIPPELQVSEKLIVGFCPVNVDRDLCYGYSPLKVWNSDGNFINSVILNSGRIDYFAFCLSNDLLVYRHSETTVKVWKPITDEEISEFKVQSEIFKIDKSINNLLVLSYDRYFDVWDYKAGTKLYSVQTVDDTDTVIQDRIKINKYYYAKQDRNKKIVTVFSFYSEFTDNEDNNDNNFDSNFMMRDYDKRICCDISKSIM